MSTMTSSVPNTATPPAATVKKWDDPFKPQGYYRMARMMGKSDNLAIFRRFNDLNMLSLLDLQAEIQSLREQLYTQCEEDSGQGREFSTSMKKLRESRQSSSPEHYELLLTIRERMNQYSQ
jgi:hypothetical protein